MNQFSINDYDRERFSYMLGKNISSFNKVSEECLFMKNHRTIYFWNEQADEESGVLVKTDKKGIIKELVSVDLFRC